MIQAERRSHSIANELEESKTQLELADRQRRAAEQELSDVVEQLSDQTLQNQALQTAKRKLDSEIQTLQASFLIKIISPVGISQADLEEMVCESMVAEERAKKSMIDAARLADELRAEQENAQLSEKNRRSLDSQVLQTSPNTFLSRQVKDMQTKLDEAEQLAVQGGRKVTSRLEQKIKVFSF